MMLKKALCPSPPPSKQAGDNLSACFQKGTPKQRVDVTAARVQLIFSMGSKWQCEDFNMSEE